MPAPDNWPPDLMDALGRSIDQARDAQQQHRTTANTLAHRIKVSELRAAVGRADWSLVALLATELDGWDFDA